MPLDRSTRLTALAVAFSLAFAACTPGPGVSPTPPEPAATTAPPGGSPDAPSPGSSLGPGEALQAMLDARRESYAAPGALAVVRLGGTEWAAASGAADLAGTPLDDQARFRIASITKPIVAALVVDAVGRGELGLDDVVGDLVPGLLRPDPPVTVRQLLDHTSGIFDTSNEGDVSDVERLPPALRAEAEELWRRYTDGEAVVARAEIWVALAETRDRYFEPGTDYHYSNTNYQLVGLVLEAATGRSLDALLRERIVEPLGLTRTTLAPFDAADPELRGYDLDAVDGTLVDVTGNLFAFANGGNGGIISTASELLTIMQAIAQGRFATPELLADQTAPNRANYGLGIATYALACGASALGHEGSVNGTRSIALVSPDGRDGVVIAFNLRSESDPLLPYLAGRALCWR